MESKNNNSTVMNIALIEDEEEHARILKSNLEKYGKLHDIHFETKWFSDAMDFLSSYKKQFDIVFMDIELPYLNGMSAAEKLRKIDEDVCLIFVTNLAQYAVKGYAVRATDYLVKPIVYSAFSFCMDRAVKLVKNRQGNEAYLQVSRGWIRLNFRDIISIEANGHKLIYHTQKQDYEVWDTIKRIAPQYEKAGFASPRAGVLLNLQYVRRIEGDDVYIFDKIYALSRAKRKEFLSQFTVYFSEL